MSPKLIRILSVIIGIVIFILIVIIGFRVFGSRAADVQPGTVKIDEITQNSAKITWSTDQPTIGAVKYGTSEGSLNFYAPETLKDPASSHSVELTLLSPGSMYYFQIQIGDKLYDNAGVSWTFSTTSNGAAGGTTSIVASPTSAASSSSSSASLSPTPIQSIEVPKTSPTVAVVCGETDCAKTKAKMGAGCSAQDLVKNCFPTTSQ